jgi:hypothetical protein
MLFLRPFLPISFFSYTCFSPIPTRIAIATATPNSNGSAEKLRFTRNSALRYITIKPGKERTASARV